MPTMVQVDVKQIIEGLKGHNGIKQRKYTFQETVVLEAEFSSKSNKSMKGLSGMDTPSKILRLFEQLPPPIPRPIKNSACVKQI